ncbi:apolipoprotein N-acyltransferase [Phaeodactylibacter luteus]|uniref:Apolipoprotein N-acyltransferase n=1 Tax=Phaeodactylibacter luteus TaxID=1564516 RepID=A0A5C6RK21_9BACT|nr:apolipoprotein N-acyltransferase [Phaeodactylibacter luteus]TXB62245.1 apolipoprotein N-acyltransferase [Phaeodactylibacter luteus]
MNKTIHYAGIVLFTLLAVYTGYDMARLGGLGQLWGYRPLWCLLSFWAATVLAVKVFRPGSWDKLGLATAGGVLLAVGFPDILPLPWLLMVGFVPLLIIEDWISREKGGRSLGAVFRYSYHAFVLWNIIATYWVANTAFVAGIFAIWVNALLMTVPVLLFHTTRWAMPKLRYAALICYWLAFEYVHLNWELTWPWLTLGNGFAEYPSLVQWYEYTGVFGGSLWVLLSNVLFFKVWQAARAKGWKAAGWLRPALWVVLPMSISLALYLRFEPNGEEREVAVVQPNFEPHYVKFKMPEKEQIERFLALSEPVISEQTDYLVFPETSFGLVNTAAILSYPAVKALSPLLEKYPELNLVTGIDGYHEFREGEPLTRAARMVVRRGGDTLRYEVLNAAIQLNAGQQEVPVYRKSKLVPGPEIFPFKELLFFLEPLVDRLEGTTAGVGTQAERSVLESPAGRVAPVICYESIFGEYVTGYVRKGAQAVFIMTNDGWWDNTAGHRQHLYMASLRAIETRRSVARSANTGVSAFINQRGDILQPTRYGEATAIRQRIYFSDRVTFYVVWGDLIARIALFGSALLLLNTLVRSLIPKEGRA